MPKLVGGAKLKDGKTSCYLYSKSDEMDGRGGKKASIYSQPYFSDTMITISK